MPKKECICETCPSFTKCDENIAYCLTEKSRCITEKKGCVCGGCPIHKKMGFNNYYYCLNGAEKK